MSSFIILLFIRSSGVTGVTGVTGVQKFRSSEVQKFRQYFCPHPSMTLG
jgi:hypothetical protein